MSAHAVDPYVTFCEGVRRLTGIDLLQYKRTQMERRIRSFASGRGVAELARYLHLISNDDDELQSFLDRVTINVSQLWRNPEVWSALAETELPELAAARRISIWSAGSSYGAEAYTLAALCLEQDRRCKVEIVGTDIDARMIERARGGWFSAEDARTAPPQLLAKWFEPGDGGAVVAGREIKAVARFETGDLLRMPFPSGRYDLVVCRNTVIYFAEPVRDELHARLASAIRPGGYLLIGSTERVSESSSIGLEPVRPFLYRKAA
jgi:chemotaxis protein methyltransferase CheR